MEDPGVSRVTSLGRIISKRKREDDPLEVIPAGKLQCTGNGLPFLAGNVLTSFSNTRGITSQT